MQKFSFKQQVLGGFMLTLVVVFIVAFASYISINALQKADMMVNHTHEVLKTADMVREKLLEAETSERGYLISGMPRFLDGYTRSVDYIHNTIATLRDMTADNPNQAANIDSLSKYGALKVAYMKSLLALYETHGYEAVRTEIQAGRGISYMTEVNESLARLEQIENELLQERKAENAKSVYRTLAIIMAGSFLILCLVLTLLNYIRKTFNLQKRTEKRLRDSNIKLETVSRENDRQNWLLEGAVIVDAAMRGAQNLDIRAENIIHAVAKHLKADLGVIYIADQSGKTLSVKASYAFPMEDATKIIYSVDGMIGQAVSQKHGISITSVPDDYIKVGSGLGSTSPRSIFIQPIFLQDQLKGVIELAFIDAENPYIAEFFNKVVYSIAVAIQAAEARVEMQHLFEQTQQQAEELESQHEELRTTNEELTRKTSQLQASEEELMVQQEELRQTNSELEEKAELLEERNRTIEQANLAIQMKAEEIEQTSKYKSEFLANMSHELRTPLNSILILAKILQENKQETLTPDQIKYAGVIHTAGSDLLNLINDILDLSKIESGKVELTQESIDVQEIKEDTELLFNEVARNRKLNFHFNIAHSVPSKITSDRQRVEQIIKNLLSNAFKFTPSGGMVTVDVELADGVNFTHPALQNTGEVIGFHVKDTGIGISSDKQKAIFEAFQQADGSTSRKYGGTGLGLSISKELAALLDGEIHLKSAQGQGSTFSLYLPVTPAAKANAKQNDVVIEAWNSPNVEPPKERRPDPLAGKLKLPDAKKEYTLLIVEDDPNFAEILKDYAIERGFKPLLAFDGDAALKMAKDVLPDAIVLDIMLPVLDGWTVLKHLKEDPSTYRIPVHLMSAKDEASSKAKIEGAIGFLKKPVDKDELDHAFDILIEDSGKNKINRVLLVEDQRVQSDALTNQLLAKKVEVKQAFDGEETIRILDEDENFDCIILDLNLPDISGLDLLERIKSRQNLTGIPVVINTAMELDKDSMARVMKYTHAMVLKSNKSNDRLLDEVNLFMNKIRTSHSNTSAGGTLVSSLKNANTVTIERALKNKSVLIVDDDMRNIFALSSALEEYDFRIEIANNGHEALRKLDANPDTDIVLMDIMMPEMDGYEAILEIRKQSRFTKLPIIALTAKAMKNDRDKCIEAGANDYISKPVEVGKLVSMMRVWLS
ncbi:response regulator [Desertivirga xinjiangensis]|uniref:response regulator n=1 Tax=Desertivirga xinjiangensis TaxID=539206 RepID=UPI0021090778|nr:response regulator [Pedobacter xinjiangensis]